MDDLKKSKNKNKMEKQKTVEKTKEKEAGTKTAPVVSTETKNESIETAPILENHLALVNKPQNNQKSIELVLENYKTLEKQSESDKLIIQYLECVLKEMARDIEVFNAEIVK